MRIQGFLVGLTSRNLVLLIFLLLSRTESALARAEPPVLRGRALEIVDGQTVMLRLIDGTRAPDRAGAVRQ